MKRLLPRHHRILDLCIQGLNSGSIAEILGMHKDSISLITRSPLFQDALARRRDKHTETIDQKDAETLTRSRALLEEASEQAAQTQIDLLDEDKNDSIRLRASQHILDRVFGDGSIPRDSKQKVEINAKQVQVLQLAINESVGIS